jgi:hypothetical protein
VGVVLAAWLVEIGVQTWKGGKANRVPVWGASLPVPSIFLADMLLFGALAFGAKESSNLKTPAALLAWGFVIATFLNNPAAPAALVATLTKTNKPASLSTPEIQVPGGIGPKTSGELAAS